MAIEIHKKGVRADLEPRREPYWGAPLGKGRHLGVRKLDDGTCTWIAKLRDDDGKKHYKSLGQVTDANDIGAAKKAAEQWFEGFERGIDAKKAPTVEDACREYVETLEADGRGATAKGDRRKDPNAIPGWGAAHDADMRFKRHVYDTTFGRTKLEKLRTKTLRDWRNGLGGTKASQNRNWTALRRALNLAVEHRLVHPAVAIEWRSLKQHKKADGRRDIYLDRKQRRAFLEAATGAVRDLIEAAALTGARPGELVALERRHFDARTETLTLAGKTGARTVPLSPAAVKLFKRLSKDKLPAAKLLPADGGKPWPHSGWDEGVRAAAEAAELPKGVVLYTLRHSFITEALRGGMSTLDVARLTGTSLPMIEANYGHLVASAARERLATVEML